ncbi:hypothetical protein D3C77_599400 [compost metagenome]
MLADPDYNFTYKGPGNTYIEIIDTNEGLITGWSKGDLFSVTYIKGNIVKKYSAMPSGNKKEDALNEEVLKYLRSIQQQVLPHLKKFEDLSKLVQLN